jgi:hypothetical protein
MPAAFTQVAGAMDMHALQLARLVSKPQRRGRHDFALSRRTFCLV